MAAVTATRRTEASSQAPIPPTDLLLLHSPAKLSLYVGSRHVCDIRLRIPGLGDGLSPYKGFTRCSPAAHTETESGELCSVVMLASKFYMTVSPRLWILYPKPIISMICTKVTALEYTFHFRCQHSALRLCFLCRRANVICVL